MPRKVSLQDFQRKRDKSQPITMLTAYDYPAARLVDEAGVDAILVGDTLAMTVLGHRDTVSVTVDEMLHHCKAVARGASRALLVGDMPFMSYQVSTEEALRNAGRLVQEGGAQAVKLEGGARSAETVRRIVEAGIPVMGHIGLTPQSEHALGGFRVQGKDLAGALALVDDAVALEQAGAFAVVLETIPSELARIITERLTIPTIGIGAGPDCDGEIQVIYEILGLTPRPHKHAAVYANLGEAITQALAAYQREVQEHRFPTEDHSFHMDEAILEDLLATT
jgi:3-methyl-2-oxobutanoate hydroxymethyltransferase